MMYLPHIATLLDYLELTALSLFAASSHTLMPLDSETSTAPRYWQKINKTFNRLHKVLKVSKVCKSLVISFVY